jgi:hypothetical protein
MSQPVQHCRRLSSSSARETRSAVGRGRDHVAARPLCRVAILGGDARQKSRWAPYGAPIFFKARRYGGNGELRRLHSALRAGSIDLVIILARWNGHSVTRKVRHLCRRLGVDVFVVP